MTGIYFVISDEWVKGEVSFTMDLQVKRSVFFLVEMARRGKQKGYKLDTLLHKY
jgi:hypothetical protein